MNVTLLMNAAGGGGAEKQALLNAAQLVAAGHRCRVFCLARLAPHERMERIIAEVSAAGVEVHRPTRETSFSPGMVWRLFRLLSQGESHLLWTWGYRAEVVRIFLLFAFWRVRSVVSLRSAHAEEMLRMRWLWELSTLASPAYISNSRLNCEMLARLLPAAAARAVVIHNIMEPAALNEPAVALPQNVDRLELVMLGNVRIAIKGYDLAVQLARRLKDRKINLRLRIAGFPHEGKELQALIEAAGVQDVVEVTGVVFRPFEFLRSGNVFLLLSRVEGMPNALLEAMALGLPCIATRVGDVGNFVRDREHLRIVELEAVHATEAILLEWREQWSSARHLGAAARILCQRAFTPAVIGRQLREVFEHLGNELAPDAQGPAI